MNSKTLNKAITTFLAFIFIALPSFVFAQAESINPGSENIFRAYDKIFVVVLVLFTILVGIKLVLIYLERRLKRLEKKVGSNSSDQVT